MSELVGMGALGGPHGPRAGGRVRRQVSWGAARFSSLGASMGLEEEQAAQCEEVEMGLYVQDSSLPHLSSVLQQIHEQHHHHHQLHGAPHVAATPSARLVQYPGAGTTHQGPPPLLRKKRTMASAASLLGSASPSPPPKPQSGEYKLSLSFFKGKNVNLVRVQCWILRRQYLWAAGSGSAFGRYRTSEVGGWVQLFWHP